MSTDINIVIVNYNVQYFIEQCLSSIYNVSDFEGSLEVIVVDNDSTDGSVQMIKDKFPDVELIENKENVGFSVANNQGINISTGKYILILNPDTILEEDTLSSCFKEMEADVEIGALGVQMLDGAGRFLPESKRGFPSPLVSFYRFTGLFKLFPHSPKINAYYQGHIDQNEKAEVDILCGAFMFMRKSILDEIGLLDEAFFMYGEDIDLSYRFKKAGYKVMYFPETTIIHFKGESTRKQSREYTRRFYDAMNIFAKKHFKDSKANIFMKYLSIVIQLKASLNLVKNFITKIYLPVIDILFLFFGLHAVSFIWAKYYFKEPDYYSNAPLDTNFLIYTFVWFAFLFFGGAYDKSISIFRLVRNFLLGTLVIMAIYGILDSEYRSSRAIIFIATAFELILLLGFRWILSLFTGKSFDGFSKGKNLIIIANDKEALKIENILMQSATQIDSIKALPVNVSDYELKEIILIENIDEVICNIKDVSMSRIIELMSKLGNKVAFKITGEESLGIIGSQSKNKVGEIYTIGINYSIQSEHNIRIKRSFDIIVSLLSIFLFPLFLIAKSLRKITLKSPSVLSGDLTIVGYQDDKRKVDNLPKLKAPVINVPSADRLSYAKDYSVWKDFRYLWKSIFKKTDDQ
ncbi:glycosyltransferase family 2 protein [Portibacter lacus]|uniref:Glycosyltransferase 2-like domain-containing protein n=1 Tax=Portibacter lacus TaxID=1099794 RepID=A0AA37WG25_9BACT|nr:glycosyltransferase family 2 protein [Portibacter lacus]GLR19363.1 hypothetical protein GCM10007940_39790 [Portibacter lacus]